MLIGRVERSGRSYLVAMEARSGIAPNEANLISKKKKKSKI